MDNLPPAEELLKKIEELEAGHAQLRQQMSRLKISEEQRNDRQRSHSISQQRSFRRRGGGRSAASVLRSTSFRHSSPLQRESRNREDDNSNSDVGGRGEPPVVKFTDRQYLNILQSMGQSVHIYDLNAKVIYWLVVHLITCYFFWSFVYLFHGLNRRKFSIIRCDSFRLTIACDCELAFHKHQ